MGPVVQNTRINARRIGIISECFEGGTPVIDTVRIESTGAPEVGIDVLGGDAILSNITRVWRGGISTRFAGAGTQRIDGLADSAINFTPVIVVDIRAESTLVVRRVQSFNPNGIAAIRVADGAAPDLGTTASPGENAFLGVGVQHNGDAVVSAIGNSWQNEPPQCGVDIDTTGSGAVVASDTLQCP